MTQDEIIIAMAREAGAFRNYFDYGVEGFAFVDDETLERFAALVAAHEREAIAQMFDDPPKLISSAQNNEGGCLICGFTPKIAAAAIRSRNNHG